MIAGVEMVAGCLLLWLGAEWLVKGAAGIALRAGVSALAVGLTVVGYGTATPELVVNVLASLEGRAALAMGTLVGASLFNLGLTLGLSAVIAPPRVHPGLVRREVPVLVACAVLMSLLVMLGRVNRLAGLFLLAGGVAFTVWVIRGRDVPEHEESAATVALPGRAAAVAYALAGLALLLGGGKLFVVGATRAALSLGVGDAVVGLTVVGMGTALPELAASLVAARRGHSDIAVGNALGSNIFYVLFVLGIDALIRPLSLGTVIPWYQVGPLLLLTVLAAVFLAGERRLSRAEGLLLLGGYAGALLLVLATS